MRETVVLSSDVVLEAVKVGRLTAYPVVRAALGILPGDTITAREVSAEQVRRIYERRQRLIAGRHPLVDSVDELLANMRRYRGSELLMLVLSEGQRTLCLWLSTSGRELLGVMVIGPESSASDSGDI